MGILHAKAKCSTRQPKTQIKKQKRWPRIAAAETDGSKSPSPYDEPPTPHRNKCFRKEQNSQIIHHQAAFLKSKTGMACAIFPMRCELMKKGQLQEHLSQIRSDALQHVMLFQCRWCYRRFGKKHGRDRHEALKTKFTDKGYSRPKYCQQGNIREKRNTPTQERRLLMLRSKKIKCSEQITYAAGEDWVTGFEKIILDRMCEEFEIKDPDISLNAMLKISKIYFDRAIEIGKSIPEVWPKGLTDDEDDAQHDEREGSPHFRGPPSLPLGEYSPDSEGPPTPAEQYLKQYQYTTEQFENSPSECPPHEFPQSMDYGTHYAYQYIPDQDTQDQESQQYLIFPTPEPHIRDLDAISPPHNTQTIQYYALRGGGEGLMWSQSSDNVCFYEPPTTSRASDYNIDPTLEGLHPDDGFHMHEMLDGIDSDDTIHSSGVNTPVYY